MLLKVENLVVYYGAVEVLHEVSISIKEGEIVGVLGPNGAGKTTLLMTISGILRQKKGKVLFEDKNLIKVSSADVVKMGIAHCPEGRHVFPELTVKENLEIGAYIRKDKEIVKKDIENMFEKFPILGKRQSQLAGTLSGGEQQMLAISRALLSKPKLLLLDEPSLGLAPIIIEEVFKIIKEIHNDGVSILIVEQNARMTLNVVDRAYILESGKIKTQGSSFDLKRNENVKKIYLGID
ncbi:MAG: ABC transporter related protein [Atribacteria bacterium 34_128]|jgi:branched-chain amino acid transport system ATP-binding protein|nr:MAG: ABC transporter related protein [Atribacteria bacterium 34_128]